MTYGFTTGQITIREGEDAEVTVAFLDPAMVELTVQLDVSFASGGTELREPFNSQHMAGSRGDWEIGSLGGWEVGRLGGWEFGRLGVWEVGRLGGWEVGRLGGWEVGRCGGMRGEWEARQKRWR